jgi:hypothetical protein
MDLELRELTDVKRQLIEPQPELELNESGLILNYQKPSTIRLRCEFGARDTGPFSSAMKFIMRKGHAATRRGRWGATVESAFAAASFKILSTGTPFRKGKGNNPISFVDCNEDGRVHLYSYEMAIRDGVCCPIKFNHQDGESAGQKYHHC